MRFFDFLGSLFRAPVAATSLAGGLANHALSEPPRQALFAAFSATPASTSSEDEGTQKSAISSDMIKSYMERLDQAQRQITSCAESTIREARNLKADAEIKGTRFDLDVAQFEIHRSTMNVPVTQAQVEQLRRIAENRETRLERTGAQKKISA